MRPWTNEVLAHAYFKGEDQGTLLDSLRENEGPYWNLVGNGNFLSTVDDLYTWMLALTENRVFSEDLTEKLFTTHVAEKAGGDRFYGYGWRVGTTSRGTRLVTHGGGDGFSIFANIRWYRDENVFIIFLSNTFEAYSAEIHRMIEALSFPPPAE